MKKTLCLILLLIFAVTLSSCEEKPEDKITGTWRAAYYEYSDGTRRPAEGPLPFITFHKNGEAVVGSEGNNETTVYTWEFIEGDLIYIYKVRNFDEFLFELKNEEILFQPGMCAVPKWVYIKSSK